MGIARTFQNIRLFHDMSIVDNIKVAARHEATYGIVTSLFHPPGCFGKPSTSSTFIAANFSQFWLTNKAGDRSSSLAYGSSGGLNRAAMATRLPCFCSTSLQPA